MQIISNNNNCYLASVTMTYGSAYQEKCLYSSDFSEWASCDMKTTTNKVVNLKTSYSRENFTATLNGVGAYPTGEKTSGDNTYTGFLESAKVLECNFEASTNSSSSSLPQVALAVGMSRLRATVMRIG